MDVGTSTDRRFSGYRFPAIIIGEVVWLRDRSLRVVTAGHAFVQNLRRVTTNSPSTYPHKTQSPPPSPN